MNITEKMQKALEGIHGYSDLAAAHIGNAFFRAWRALEESGNERFDFRDISECDVEVTVENLLAAGQTEFTVSDRSTALMNVVEELVEEGCTLVGFVKVNDDHPCRETKQPKSIPALLFRLPV